jgi:hypothetical protein
MSYEVIGTEALEVDALKRRLIDARARCEDLLRHVVSHADEGLASGGETLHGEPDDWRRPAG